MNALEAIELLQRLIRIPSFSREEDKTADLLSEFMSKRGVSISRHKNNIWASSPLDDKKPTILLNSHHDTVKPVDGWIANPFGAKLKDGRLTGLGSNDAGASLVCLLSAFLRVFKTNRKSNLVFAATSEEEISGEGGIVSIIDKLPAIDLAIVGEPTRMKAAIAEKGLMVVDCKANGISGHAAREEGKNAIDVALRDIQWLHNYKFSKESDTLGSVKMTVTMINSGIQHNVIPDSCEFTIDVRSTDEFTNDEILQVISKNIESKVTARSLRLQPSGLRADHPLYKTAMELGISVYGSPTLSDQAFMPWPSIKMGPGDSARSHTADEYIFVEEIEKGIEKYVLFLNELDEQL